MVEDANTKQNLEITVRLHLKLTMDMFEKVYAHTKARYELDLMKKKEPMVRTFEFIKQICDAFPEVKFDGSKMCFFDESEEMAKWNLQDDFDEGSEKDNHSRRGGCECCILF